MGGVRCPQQRIFFATAGLHKKVGLTEGCLYIEVSAARWRNTERNYLAAFSLLSANNESNQLGTGAPMAAPFSAMEPNSVKIYHTNTTGRTTPSKSNPTPSPNAGRFSTATFKTKSVSAATQTTTTMPALCQIPARAAALIHYHAGGGRAAAQPIQRHAGRPGQHQPAQPPKRRRKGLWHFARPRRLLAAKKPFFLSKFPFIFKHSIHFCTNLRPPARG